MNRRSLTLAIAAGVWGIAGPGPSHAQETLEVSGGTTPQKDILEPKAAAFEKATGIRLKVNGVGTGNGMLALSEGQVKVAAVGDTLASSIEAGRKAAKAAGKEPKIPDNLVFHEIGKDELVVIVHKTNPVSALTKTQLKDLATGRLTNWKEVGGPDLPVRVVTTKAGLVPGQFFQKFIMDDAPYAAGAVEAQSPRDVISWVSRTPGAFGMAAEIHFSAGPGDAKRIVAPSMERPLALVTIGQPTGSIKSLVDFYRVR